MSSLQRYFVTCLRRFAVGATLPAALLACPEQAAPPSAGTTSPPSFQVPVGRVELDFEDSNVEEALGGAFALGVRSGANSCYLAALQTTPGEAGAIAFVVEPPPGEGPFLVTLQRTGAIGDPLAACVKGVFRDFYHYQDHPRFDQVRGTLRFAPKFVSAPPPPSDAALRAALDSGYSGAPQKGMVRIVKAELRSLTHDADSSEILSRYSYALELELLTDGYETACSHYETYKVFSRTPYRSPYAGHSCESRARKAGERTSDTQGLIYRLELYPAVGQEWELRGGGQAGTIPEPPEP